MARPDDIPEHVWETAEMLVVSVDGVPTEGHTYNIARAIIAAKAEEREACAQVAEAPRIAWSSSEYSGGFNDGCNTVAAAIRKRGEG